MTCPGDEITCNSEQVTSHANEVIRNSGQVTRPANEVTCNSGQLTRPADEIISNLDEVIAFRMRKTGEPGNVPHGLLLAVAGLIQPRE